MKLNSSGLKPMTTFKPLVMDKYVSVSVQVWFALETCSGGGMTFKVTAHTNGGVIECEFGNADDADAYMDYLACEFGLVS